MEKIKVRNLVGKEAETKMIQEAADRFFVNERIREALVLDEIAFSMTHGIQLFEDEEKLVTKILFDLSGLTDQKVH